MPRKFLRFCSKRERGKTRCFLLKITGTFKTLPYGCVTQLAFSPPLDLAAKSGTQAGGKSTFQMYTSGFFPGPRAHTVKYCPANNNPPTVSMMSTLKSMRSATGDVRDPRRCSSRSGGRSRAAGRALPKRTLKRTATGASSYGATAYLRNEVSP